MRREAVVAGHDALVVHADMVGWFHTSNVSSHNHDRLAEGMVFVLHTQWLEPLSAGCNVDDCYAVTAGGVENLSCHTPLEPHRVEVAA